MDRGATLVDAHFPAFRAVTEESTCRQNGLSFFVLAGVSRVIGLVEVYKITTNYASNLCILASYNLQTFKRVVRLS